VGIAGYGKLGQFIADKILNDEVVSQRLELVWVWNRSAEVFSTEAGSMLPEGVVLPNLDDFASRDADLIVEVAHPNISRDYGERFLEKANYLMGSPTAMADESINATVRSAAAIANGHGVYVPAGALWGGDDIQRMASTGSLRSLLVRMKKHPSSMKLQGALGEKLAAEYKEGSGEYIVYSGPLRALCPLAPNNVNTMACAAIAGHTLGFDGLQAELVADDALEAHVIDIEARGPIRPDGSSLSVITQRVNPAAPGAVTGSATYVSFVGSIMQANGRGDGVHLC